MFHLHQNVYGQQLSFRLCVILLLLGAHSYSLCHKIKTIHTVKTYQMILMGYTKEYLHWGSTEFLFTPTFFQINYVNSSLERLPLPVLQELILNLSGFL